MTRVTLYGKAGCCLCADAEEAIRALMAAQPLDLVVVDVQDDPDLRARYGGRVPVVVVGETVVSEFEVDIARLRSHLDQAEGNTV